MAEPLSPRLDHTSIEASLYQSWMEKGYFEVSRTAVAEQGRDPYVIIIPPPNVTAVLHMGHGLNNTIQDVLIRWRRMQGRAALWVPGTDHAGIATQNVVERQLGSEGLTRFDVGREGFTERVWSFVDKTGATILDQLKAIGCSCDWDRTFFTLDPGLSRAVREVFVQLFEKGLVYRGEYIINWCPRCLTALSNEEAEGEDADGKLYHLRYPIDASGAGAAEVAAGKGATAMGQLEDGTWYLTVSTTRPETMLGDMAVAVHPGDERYQGLIGADVGLPLTGRSIPIISDDFVDPEFGSGMVKVTPAHDPNDFDMAQRAGLTPMDILTPEASMNENVPEPFRGMDRFDARTAVLEALEAAGLLAGVDDHQHAVPHCYRCHTVVEPRLSEQWFVRTKPLAEPALAASRDGTITFTPPRWKKVYEHWMENIRDWCISRQLWWGHRIPVWYCEDCGEMSVAREDPTACQACGSDAIEQDPDVLDTWFSSWLLPFSGFNWPEDDADLKVFYPTHTLTTAPEILFFWVARMIMAGYEFMGEAPFTEVYLHGTVRDRLGRKMSKSLGNGIDPLEVVEKFGADALRYTLISACAVGTDIRLDHEDLEASFAPGRNFANKIWNVGRFTLMSVGESPVRTIGEVEPHLETADRWILSRLDETTERVSDRLERFRLHEVCEELYRFLWGDFADWYLELVKPRLFADADAESREAARATLVFTLDRVLRLLHPLVPFVTSELWARLPWPEGSTEERAEDLIVAPWPDFDPTRRDASAVAELEDLQQLITAVRSLRKEYGIPEKAEVDVYLGGVNDVRRVGVESQRPALRRMARIGTLEFEIPEGGTVGASAVLNSGVEVFLPLEGLIDVTRECERLEGEISRLSGQLDGVRKKLANEKFVGRAPADVVEKERAKADSFGVKLEKLREKHAALAGR